MELKTNLFVGPRQVLVSILAATRQRPQTQAEERANSLSAGLGLLAAVVGGVALIVTAAQRSAQGFLVGAIVYVMTLASLYLSSTLYHAWPVGPAKSKLLVVDHTVIFLFIAGTYTPFALGVLRGALGIELLIVIWGLAVAGVMLKLIGGAERYPRLSLGLYLGMGWVFMLVAGPIWHLMAWAGLLWLLGGGLAFTAGVLFFRAEQIRYAHFVWHLFVLTGTICHFVAIWYYASGV